MNKNIVALFAALAFASVASAGPIVVGQWYTFGFGGPGTSWTATDMGCCTLGLDSLALDDPAWTITLSVDSIMTVVDGFDAGDTFEVLDFGIPLGFTSLPGVGDCGNDELACLASGVHSTGLYMLAAGDHSLTGAVADSPFGGGAAFFRIDPVAVAEPGVLVLFALGLIGFAARFRRGGLVVR